MRLGFEKSKERKKIPQWKKRENELWAPEKHIDSVRLEVYDCEWFDKKTGLCKNYEDRPDICRRSKCRAFEVQDSEEQKKIIEEIKSEKFIKIKPFKIK